jgi:hypothetical protein
MILKLRWCSVSAKSEKGRKEEGTFINVLGSVVNFDP